MLSARVAARAGLRNFQVPRSVAVGGLRTYAAAAQQDVRPPVALYGVDGTYANALYTASAKTSSLDSIAKSLSQLGEVFKKDAKLTTILNAPTLSVSDKQQIIKELQTVAGGDKNDILKNFLSTLAENNRLGLLEGVIEKFQTLMSAHKGEIELSITSAQELDTKSIQRIEKAVAKSEISQGKKLKVVTKVNPDVLGGLIVEVGDRTIDLSVSSKINRLNKALTDAV
ncbi:ATP synthase oligomycin sensitivity conferral protein, putative [Talaromyces stipitatus ATCC 10500]|uniref:ATP synthase subunit 5, mitochondrial n=1 Tax=Talaromyces stipitatus (strain ATCC 10500 / CBS 375.48 / QM 6759 / NRRL 1006) TaxID=441959 RepID=B8MLF0_TALSN|nr:ATP synthase oligomycin sensitivity conferral protein, putative [Talaromyces stipitatus ATCC 10500]EED15483.1 ATP synthase oligomycin sensitivity conferral protein, putative [Talaromyces stipitatus ATCC 10500]